jgi:hypothetical protein
MTAKESAAKAGPAQSISSAAPQGIRERASTWAQNVSNDIKYGTDVTGIGTLLKKMGAHGVYSGNPEAVGDYMASIPLGILKAGKGEADISQGKVWQGTKEFVGGVAQQTQIPAGFLGPEEAGGAVAAKVGEVMPAAKLARAGEAFSQIEKAIGGHQVDAVEAGNRALRIKEIAGSGGREPKVIKDFIARMTNPDKGPLTYNEARDFLGNASNLAFDESSKLNAVLKREMQQFAGELKGAIKETADKAGRLSDYQKAVSDYASARRWEGLVGSVKDLAEKETFKTVARGLLGGGTLAMGEQAVKKYLFGGK